jgi:hypothetical protein
MPLQGFVLFIEGRKTQIPDHPMPTSYLHAQCILLLDFRLYVRAYDYSFPITQSVELPVGNMHSPTRSPAGGFPVLAHWLLFSYTTTIHGVCLGCKPIVFGRGTENGQENPNDCVSCPDVIRWRGWLERAGVSQIHSPYVFGYISYKGSGCFRTKHSISLPLRLFSSFRASRTFEQISRLRSCCGTNASKLPFAGRC